MDNRSLTERVEVLEEKVESLSTLPAQMSTLTGRVDTLTGRVDTLTDRVDTLTREVSGFREETRRELATLNSRHEMLHEEMHVLHQICMNRFDRLRDDVRQDLAVVHQDLIARIDALGARRKRKS
jgi:chromosome segregation ATPase